MTTAPYGSWPSPISAELVAEGATRLREPLPDPARPGDLYWIEARPHEDGRQVVVRREDGGKTRDVIPAGFNARTRVHEYGGGSFAVHDGTVWFTNFVDQRLYRVSPDSDPSPITSDDDGSVRYADLVVTPDGEHLVCVRETHGGDAATDVVNELVALPADGDGEAVVLATGRDFYASPALDGDAVRLAWLEWDHPNMPWDGTELRVAAFGHDGVEEPSTAAGSSDESIFQPAWSPDGLLTFVSDRTGFWNLYRQRDDGETEALYPSSAEFGEPQWVFGQSTYAFVGERMVCKRFEDGADRLFLLDPDARRYDPIDLASTSVSYVRSCDGVVVFVGASPYDAPALCTYDPDTERIDVLRRSSDTEVEVSLISVPEEISFPTEDGETAHALYYPPENPDTTGPDDELPPLVVHAHGGPTAHVTAALDLSVQYLTSRGIAVVDVNYRGSSGYGREYRQALEGRWGEADVADCVAAVRYLAERGDIDRDRVMIEGGSAGGYTTLRALTTSDVFTAGATWYGVGDLGALAEHTHKFESRYLDRLVGPYPQERERYEELSPLNHLDGLSAPMIVLQGAEDQVVPPAQAHAIVEACDQRGLAYHYLEFDDEQHGFRKAGNQIRAIESVLSFLGQVFGFEPADDIDPVELTNA